MAALSASDMIQVWELGQNRPLWYRALLLLSPAFPQVSHEELSGLSIGRRNIRLFQLREQVFGSTMNARINCPQCTEALEFAINIQDVFPSSTEPAAEHYSTEIDGFEITFRLLDSHDFAIASQHPPIHNTRNTLIHHCILQAISNGKAIEISDLPESVITALGDQLLDQDPLAELLLSLNCSNCGHAWSDNFDITAFLWSEVSARAQRLLEEVHTLARAYGWSEPHILKMTAARRQYYLQKALE